MNDTGRFSSTARQTTFLVVAFVVVIAVYLTTAVAGSAANRGKTRDKAKDPLVLEAEGSFFVGGETKASDALSGLSTGYHGTNHGDVTVNQMYVQYQIPKDADRHVPVVMVHGCCLSAKSWETTPDGRMGWSEYFARENRPVYLVDQVSRARSGYDPETINKVKLGILPPSQLPNINMASHQAAWTLFRFGPSYGTAFPDEQFPLQAVDEFYKQLIPDISGMLPRPNPTWKNLSALSIKLHGAILMGHSQSGFFPEQTALLNPSDIKGLITIEVGCSPNLTPDQISTLAKIPILVMFGDHLGDVPASAAMWTGAFTSCQKFVERIKSAGGDAQLMHLPEMGLSGNSHMLMLDKDNLQIADLILGWIDHHVEGRKPDR